MNSDLVFTTAPKLVESFQQQTGIFASRENYEDKDKPRGSTEEFFLMILWVLFILLWVWALMIVLHTVKRGREKGAQMNYAFVIFLLFILFYMPMFGTIVVFVVLYPEVRKLK
jgi:tryptophan-rich sensory protein